jgi:hypothetical protein
MADSVAVSVERDCGCDEPSPPAPKAPVGWRAWCSDWDPETGGPVYDSSTCTWDDVPMVGVLYKIIYYSDGTRQAQTAEYYYEEETPRGLVQGTAASLDEIAELHPDAVVRRGLWVPDEYWYQVRAAALASTW